MGRRIRIGVLVWGAAALVYPATGSADVLRVRLHGAPAPSRRTLSSLRAVRAADASIVRATDARARRSLSVPGGVYVVAADVGAARRGGSEAVAAAVARRAHIATVRLRLHRTVAGLAAHRVARAAADAPVLTSQDVVISGAPGTSQPEIRLDGPIDGYLWEALHQDGVRVIDQTPQVAAAAVMESVLSAEGRLSTTFVYRPLSPDFVVRGEGTVFRNGRVGIQLRLTDRTGAIVAIVNGSGSVRHLRDVVVKAVRDLAAQTRAKLQEAASAPTSCENGATRGCYGTQLTVEGIFDETRGWGSGTVAGPDGHGSVSEGFDSLEHGYVGWWPRGTPFTLTATPHRGSHFDHWSGSCSGAATTCTLAAAPNLDVTGWFAEDLWTLTVDNENPDGGEAYGTQIGCGRGEDVCSRTLPGQTSDTDRFDLNVYPEASYMISALQGCDAFDGSFTDGGNCWIDATSDKTVTVDFACNPDATSPCAGTGSRRTPASARRG